MKKNNMPEFIKRFWKHIVGAFAVVGAVTAISIAISINQIHIGDVNIHTGVSQVVNTENNIETNQGSTDPVQHVDLQLENLEPCTTYEFQASLDPDFNDAKTISFTTLCEE